LHRKTTRLPALELKTSRNQRPANLIDDSLRSVITRPACGTDHYALVSHSLSSVIARSACGIDYYALVGDSSSFIVV
jgi:hypothetical protein